MLKEKWSLPAMICLGVLSVIVPLVGWIVGGLNVNVPARHRQAWLLIGLGIASFVLALVYRYSVMGQA